MKVKELLKAKSSWQQGGYASNKSGKPVLPRSKSAVRFCLLGALERCYPSASRRIAAIAKVDRYLTENYNMMTLVAWNDSPRRTWSEVKALVNKLDI